MIKDVTVGEFYICKTSELQSIRDDLKSRGYVTEYKTNGMISRVYVVAKCDLYVEDDKKE